jgi:hypothetical protein
MSSIELLDKVLTVFDFLKGNFETFISLSNAGILRGFDHISHQNIPMVKQLIHRRARLLGKYDPLFKCTDRVGVLPIGQVVGADHPMSSAGG